MKKKILIGVVSLGIIALGYSGYSPKSQQADNISTSAVQSNTTTNATPKIKSTCDGTTITKNCVVDGINYSSYIYHPATPEVSHTETKTSYKQEVTGSCTLCNDGTYSPTCATGRGACSHHGGVAQWNAPVYSTVPVNTTVEVLDTPSRGAYFEKIPE